MPYWLVLLFATSLLWAEPYDVIPLPKTGTITGSVKFPGETPPRAMFANKDEPLCPNSIPKDNLVVRQDIRGLKNAIVILEIDHGKQHGSRQAGLVFKLCKTTPRMQWIPMGGSLVLYNEDNAEHQVLGYHGDLQVFDVLLPKGQVVRRPMVKEGMHHVICKNHFWEKSWIYVSQHPYVQVTDAEGRFTMNQVPPGKYRIQAWHEGWEPAAEDANGGPQYQPLGETLSIVVRKDTVTEVKFDNLEPIFEKGM